MYFQMILLITDRIDTPDGAQALNYLILGFSQKGSSQKKRMNVSTFYFVQMALNVVTKFD